MEIKFTGKEIDVLRIIENLPGKAKAVRAYKNSITIPTNTGTKQVFIGDTVVIDGDKVTIIEK
jgi:hypothetical protein